ncbi:hypothetical protein OUZ56_006241 [Daphnia magna]|uniref:Uncharacterized protein n=1 Tax=Daphnia magna TaxID=35525 RepID=A0ABQ9YV30_9CRUS|nr:hypothetical protein OUZ56_006241 [Daphnia magna]
MEQKDRECMQIILVERIAQLERTQYGGAGENVVVNDGAVAHQSTGRSNIPRTCRDAHLADPSLSSGITSISHDSEAAIDVGHCVDLDAIPGQLTMTQAAEKCKH